MSDCPIPARPRFVVGAPFSPAPFQNEPVSLRVSNGTDVASCAYGDEEGSGGYRGRGRGQSGGSGSWRGRGRGRGQWRGGGSWRGRGRGRGKRPFEEDNDDDSVGDAGGSGGGFGRAWDDADVRQELLDATPASVLHRDNYIFDNFSNGSARKQRQKDVHCPYTLWDAYFPDDPYGPEHDHAEPIRVFEEYFRNLFEDKIETEALDALDTLLMNPVLCVDFHDAKAKTLSDFEERLKTQPLVLLACMGLAASEVLLRMARGDDRLGEHGGEDDDDDAAADAKIVRILNFPQTTPLKDLKASLMGKFISVRGTVVRVSSVKPITKQMAFICTKCQETQILAFTDGKFRMPNKCGSYGCRGKTFMPNRAVGSGTITVDWQRIRVQEKLADDQIDSGRVPRTVECELLQDLVDAAVPGDVVSVSGVIKVLATEDARRRNASQMYYLYIDVNSINKAGGGTVEQENNAGFGSGGANASSAAAQGSGDGRSGPSTTHSELFTGMSKDHVHFSRKDLYGIREIHEYPDVFKLLVHSLCPLIFGHEIVKAGLLLVLFGARRRDDEVQGVSIRSDPHILIVGDPGLGKSQMLSATVRAAPRGVYVSGNTTSTSGLTVTICKDPDSGDTALEAGALVLGDQGVCCIDEFDKMTEHQALLEAMEQQSISIAKAGIVCSLPSRTSVIAAANPVGGHYNKAKTVSENLKMNGALLSRFDLVFILLDRPDEKMDQFLSDHIMKLHSGAFKSRNDGGRGAAAAPLFARAPSSTSSTQSTLSEFGEKTLLDRLRLSRGEEIDPIPVSLLRKYIAYARMYTKPRLTTAAAVVLQRFYLTLRSKYRSVDSTPITTRQLESMIRLAEARARAELREEVTEQDAQDVIQIMKVSLWDTYEDDLGHIDFQRSQLGTGTSKKGEPKRFVAELRRIAQQSGSTMFDQDRLFAIAQDIRLKFDVFADMLDTLNLQGYLLKRGYRQYEFMAL